jgi:hypothetical protein
LGVNIEVDDDLSEVKDYESPIPVVIVCHSEHVALVVLFDFVGFNIFSPDLKMI